MGNWDYRKFKSSIFFGGFRGGRYEEEEINSYRLVAMYGKKRAVWVLVNVAMKEGRSRLEEAYVRGVIWNIYFGKRRKKND